MKRAERARATRRPRPVAIDHLPDYLTIEQLAALLQLSEQTVYRKVRTGEIPHARKIGQAWRISKRSIQRWLDGDEAQATGE